MAATLRICITLHDVTKVQKQRLLVLAFGKSFFLTIQCSKG